jgi:hypothetical protein
LKTPTVKEREIREVNAALAHHTLRLACTREFLELGSIGFAVSRAGGVLMEFVCPRCDELHLSRLFR